MKSCIKSIRRGAIINSKSGTRSVNGLKAYRCLRRFALIDRELRDFIAELAGDDVIVFDNPSFDHSIIGLSEDDRVIYSWEKMVAELMNDDNMSYEDAVEFISYNTLRMAPYIGERHPITLMYSVDDLTEGW